MTEKSDATLRKDSPEGTSLVVYDRSGSRIVDFSPGTTCVVGRQAPSTLVIDDASLSRTHARFVHEPDQGMFVEDLGSMNGTLVRGSRITRAMLQHGMEVRIGDAIVVVQDGDARNDSTLEDHDELLARVDDELTRARQFGRSMALLVLSSPRGHAASRFAPQAKSLARPVDHFGFYGASMCLVLMPEATRAEAESYGSSLDSMGLAFGVAVAPKDGSSSAELLARALLSLRGDESPDSLQAASNVVSKNSAMAALLADLARIAPTKLSVLLFGETGTGKEVIARHLHQTSGLKGEFRAINCGAIAPTLLESTLFGHEKGAFTGAMRTHKGIFEQAHGGTVFLDEVGELPPGAQVALLRVLETRTIQRVGTESDIAVDVRVIAATHKNLEDMSHDGSFRQDLVFRLDGFSATLPPLRSRPEDLALFVTTFLREANTRHGRAVRGLTPLANDLLQSYRFPGNVRELRNVIERAVVLARGENIDVCDFPERMRTLASAAKTSSPSLVAAEIVTPDSDTGASDLRERVKHYERDLLRAALRAHGGNRTKAAESLNVPLRTFFKKLRELDVDDDAG